MTRQPGSRPLRVLQLGSPTGLYGAERWILALVRYLDPARVESLIGAIKDHPEQDPEICRRAAELGFESVTIEATGKLNFAAVARLRRVLRERKVDILHTHGYKTDLIGRLATVGTRCLNVSTPHGWSTNAGWKLQVYETLDRLSFPAFDAVVPLSDDLHKGLVRLPRAAKNLHLIRNGVDISEVEDAAPLDRQAFLPGGQGFIVGYVGQLISRKRVDTLLRAFARLGVPQSALLLVGEGPQRGELEALAAAEGIADRVHFLGYREDRLSLLKAFDVMVLPSELEGIPRCVMESMAAGVPVIASDIPGCNDIVKHGQNGLLFPVGDDASLREALQALQADAARLRALGVAGRAHVQEHYSAAAMARHYTRLFEGLAC